MWALPRQTFQKAKITHLIRAGSRKIRNTRRMEVRSESSRLAAQATSVAQLMKLTNKSSPNLSRKKKQRIRRINTVKRNTKSSKRR